MRIRALLLTTLLVFATSLAEPSVASAEDGTTFAPMIAIVDIGAGGDVLPDRGASGITQCPGRLITGRGC